MRSMPQAPFRAEEPCRIYPHIHCLYEQNNKKPLRTKYADDIDDFIFLDEAQDCTPDEKDFLECANYSFVIVKLLRCQFIARNVVGIFIKLTTGLRLGYITADEGLLSRLRTHRMNCLIC